MLATFLGTSGRPAQLTSLPDLDGWVVGNSLTGFFSSLVPDNDGSSPVPTIIVRIDASTGTVQNWASVALPAYWGFLGLDGNPDAALYDGALYLLSPSGSTLSGAGTQSTLYRLPVATGS